MSEPLLPFHFVQSTLFSQIDLFSVRLLRKKTVFVFFYCVSHFFCLASTFFLLFPGR